MDDRPPDILALTEREPSLPPINPAELGAEPVIDDMPTPEPAAEPGVSEEAPPAHEETADIPPPPDPPVAPSESAKESKKSDDKKSARGFVKERKSKSKKNSPRKKSSSSVDPAPKLLGTAAAPASDIYPRYVQSSLRIYLRHLEIVL